MGSRRSRVALVILLALLLVSSFVTTASARVYRFTTVADSADGFDPFEFGCPATNNLGQVAFRAVTDSGVQAIYRVGLFSTTTIVEETSGFDFIGRNPSINDLGAVSFAATSADDGEGIFRGRGVHLL